MKSLAMIVAASENHVIGDSGELPWRLSADLRRFKKLTMGHHIIMGRKTWESIGRLLPGRTMVIVTRQQDYEVMGALTANSLESAIECCANDELPFVVGGAEIYRQALPQVTHLFLTRVHTELEGDTRLPDLDWEQWRLVESVSVAADDRNEFAVTFQDYVRNATKEDSAVRASGHDLNL